MAKHYTQVLSIRLTLSELEQIDALAQKDDRSRNYIIRKLIRESLDALQGNDLPLPEEAAG